MKLSKKVTLVGPFGVGKTSIFRRFIDDTFSEDYKSTLGVQIQKKVISLDHVELTLILWDTEGHMDLSEGRSAYLKGSHSFIYVFDLTRIDTYENINEQIEYLTNNFPDVPVKVIGNKLDSVFKTKVNDSLKKYNVKYDYLTSAKTGEHIETLFNEIAIELTQ